MHLEGMGRGTIHAAPATVGFPGSLPFHQLPLDTQKTRKKRGNPCFPGKGSKNSVDFPSLSVCLAWEKGYFLLSSLFWSPVPAWPQEKEILKSTVKYFQAAHGIKKGGAP